LLTLAARRGVLGHVHLADSNRCAAGSGHLDLKAVAAALKEGGYKGWLSAEVLPRPDSKTAAINTIMSFNRYFK
jgi:sugar phosphate isomerase/epimerase